MGRPRRRRRLRPRRATSCRCRSHDCRRRLDDRSIPQTELLILEDPVPAALGCARACSRSMDSRDEPDRDLPPHSRHSPARSRRLPNGLVQPQRPGERTGRRVVRLVATSNRCNGAAPESNRPSVGLRHTAQVLKSWTSGISSTRCLAACVSSPADVPSAVRPRSPRPARSWSMTQTARGGRPAALRCAAAVLGGSISPPRSTGERAARIERGGFEAPLLAVRPLRDTRFAALERAQSGCRLKEARRAISPPRRSGRRRSRGSDVGVSYCRSSAVWMSVRCVFASSRAARRMPWYDQPRRAA